MPFSQPGAVPGRLAALLALIVAFGALNGCANKRATEDPGAAGSELVRLAANAGRDCNAAVDAAQPQFIIGYGSLMQEASRQRSMPAVKAAYPVEVSGYRRGWFAKGGAEGLDTTYLGVVPATGGRLNAVIFQIDAGDVAAVDQREYFYCRLQVNAALFSVLKPDATPAIAGQVWLYVNRPESIAVANRDFPIVQSYVDIFVSGCLEQEERYGLPGFAQACLASTTNWPTEWVNDRIYPRRPFIHQPRAMQIDKLLKAGLPAHFPQIRFEASR